MWLWIAPAVWIGGMFPAAYLFALMQREERAKILKAQADFRARRPIYGGEEEPNTDNEDGMAFCGVVFWPLLLLFTIITGSIALAVIGITWPFRFVFNLGLTPDSRGAPPPTTHPEPSQPER